MSSPYFLVEIEGRQRICEVGRGQLPRLIADNKDLSFAPDRRRISNKYMWECINASEFGDSGKIYDLAGRECGGYKLIYGLDEWLCRGIGHLL